jgi:hypothetical protein
MIELSSMLVLVLMLVAVERRDMVGKGRMSGVGLGGFDGWISLAQELRRPEVFVVGRSS